MKKIFLLLTVLFSILALPSAYGQIPENPVTTTASGGLRTVQVNHLVICDNSYATLQACFTAAGTNRSVLIPSGQHLGETFTNPNSIVSLDLRTIPTFPTPGATTSQLGGVTLASGQTSTLLSKVATTGAYGDLSGLPSIGVIQVNSVSAPLVFNTGVLTCPSCGGGGGSTGTVTNVAAGTTPSWLTFSIDNPSTTPTLNLTATGIPNTALQNYNININGQSMNLGGTYTVTGASAAITGTANQLGLIGASGANIVGSNVSVAPAATFTGTSTGSGTLAQVAFVSGTPIVGQQVIGTGVGNPSFIYTLTNTPVAVPGSTSSGSTLVNVSSASQTYNGEQISGVGIPTGATVVCVSDTVTPPICDPGTTINISSPATSTASATYTVLSYHMALTNTPTLGATGAPVTLNLTAVPTTTFPMSAQIQSLNNIFMASQFSTYPGANNGLATVFASSNCSTSCTVMIDPGDREGYVEPNWPLQSHLIDLKAGHVYNYYHNQGLANQEIFSTSINQTLGQTYSARNFFPGAPGYDEGENGSGTSRGEYVNNFVADYFNSHTASIMNAYSATGTISQPGDINFENVNGLYINPNVFSDSSEGVTLDRWYVFSAPPFLGTITSGGLGATTLTFKCWSGRGCNDMAIYTPLIDLTTDVLSGTATYVSTTTLGGGQITNLTTNFTVPVSIQASLPYQVSIQGILFAPATSTPNVTIQFINGASTTDASAICGGGSCGNAVTVQLVNSSGATRQLSDIVNLFANYPPTTTSGGVIAAFLSPTAVGTTPAVAVAATGMGPLQAPAGSAGTVVTFAVNNPRLNDATQCSGVTLPCPFAPVAGALMDLAGPYYNEVVSPTNVGAPVGTLYPVTATIYFTHYPTTVYANTSATAGSGMVGRAYEPVSATNFDGEDRVVNLVLGSTGPNTIVSGVTKAATFTTYGINTSGVPTPIRIFHTAAIKSLINPAQTGNLNGLYGNGSQGSYAIVEPNDTFLVGDMVENTSSPSQNWTYHKEWVDIEDPYATWNHHTYYLSGPGLNGNVFNVINMNAPSSKYGQTPLVSLSILGSQVSSGVGTFYDTFAYPYLNQLTVGQSVTLNGFPTGSSSAYLNGQAITVLSTGVTNQTITGSTVANSQTVTVASTTGLFNGAPFSGTGIPQGEVVACVSANVAPPNCDPGTTIQVSPLPANSTGSYTFTYGQPYFTANVTGATSTSLFTDIGGAYTYNSGGIPSFMNWVGDMNNFVNMTTIPNSLFTIGASNSAAIWPTSQSTLQLINVSPHNVPGGSLSLYNLYAPTTGYSLSTVNSVTTMVLNGTFQTGGGGAQYVQYHTVTPYFPVSSFINNSNWMTTVATPTAITLTLPASSFGYTTTTSYSIASNVITITGSGFPYVTGGVVQLGAYPTSTFLNGVKLTLTSASSTTLVATLPTSHADVATTTETGQIYRATSGTVTEAGNAYTRSFEFSTDLWDIGNFNATNGYFNTSLTAPLLNMTLSTPASSSAICPVGQVTVDASYIYVCTAANVRKRAALASF